MTNIRVLIADDDPLVRETVKRILAATPEMMGDEAEDGQKALEKIRAEPWDVVLLDLSMPGMNSIDVLRQIRREYPLLPVLMFSVSGREQYETIALRAALRAGASGYLAKNSAPQAIVPAIRQAIGPLGSPPI